MELEACDACDRRFRALPRAVVPSPGLAGVTVAESEHEGPLSFSDDLRRWDISDAYERRYGFACGAVMDVRFAVVSEGKEILVAFTAQNGNRSEQVRGVARIVVTLAGLAVLESCTCETTEQISKKNPWGKCTRTDAVFRGFRRKPCNEYDPIVLCGKGDDDDDDSECWRTLFLPSGYAELTLGSVLEKEEAILGSEAERKLRIEACEKARVPIYEFNRDRAWLVRRHAKVLLERDIAAEVAAERARIRSALSESLSSDLIDRVVRMTPVASRDPVKNASDAFFADSIRIGDTPFSLRSDLVGDLGYGGNAVGDRVAVIGWYHPMQRMNNFAFGILPRESRAMAERERESRRKYYPTWYPDYFPLLDAPLMLRHMT